MCKQYIIIIKFIGANSIMRLIIECNVYFIILQLQREKIHKYVSYVCGTDRKYGNNGKK